MTKGLLILVCCLFALPALSRWIAAEVVSAMTQAEAQGAHGWPAIGMVFVAFVVLTRISSVATRHAPASPGPCRRTSHRLSLY